MPVSIRQKGLRPLDINFAERRALGAWARWAILAAGAVTLVSQAHSYTVTRQRVADIEMRAAQISVPREAEPAKPRDPKEIEARITAIERVVNRLTFEWHVLFAELERPVTQDIALTGIEPDPENHSVSVSGVAKDYLALLSYLGTLRESKILSNVFLKKHEIARNQPQQGIAFTLGAKWRELEKPDAGQNRED